MFNPDTAPARGTYFLGSFESAAQTLVIEPIKAAVRSDADIIRAIEELGRAPGGGLVATSDGFMTVHRATIIFTGSPQQCAGGLPHCRVGERWRAAVLWGGACRISFTDVLPISTASCTELGRRTCRFKSRPSSSL